MNNSKSNNSNITNNKYAITTNNRPLNLSHICKQINHEKYTYFLSLSHTHKYVLWRSKHFKRFEL